MKPSDLIFENLVSTLQGIIHQCFITSFGRIEEVISETAVTVELSHAIMGARSVIPCEYLTSASDAVKVTVKAKIGDPVLVIALQHKGKDTFTAKEPVAILDVSGYTILSAIAIPIGLSTEESRTRISFGDKTVFDSDVDLEVLATKITLQGGDKGAARVGDKVKVTIPANTFLVSADAGVKNPAPVEVEGTVQEGSGTVLIGD